MAARVNVKFVVFLVIGVMLVAGAGIGLFVTVYMKSGADYARLGDEAMAEGLYGEAGRNYGRAVGHDQTNEEWLKKWLAAIGKQTPNTRTAYENAYSQTYRAVIRQIATTLRTSVEDTERYLALQLEEIQRTGANRTIVQGAVNEATQMYAFYEANPTAAPDWEALRRYRGLLWRQLEGSGTTLSEEEFEQAEADLRAALRVNPADAESAAGLAMMYWTRAREAKLGDREAIYQEWLDKTMALLDELEQAAPTSPWTPVLKISIGFEADRFGRVTPEMPEAQRLAATEAMVVEYGPRVADVQQAMLAAAGDGSITPELLSRFQLLENILQRANRGRMTLKVLDEMIKSGDADPLFMLSRGRVLLEQNDFAGASEQFGKIEDLQQPPTSLAGVVLYSIKEQASRFRAQTLLSWALNEPERTDELIDNASAARDRFAEQVGTDNTQLLLLDGLIAAAKGENEDAITNLRQYNEATGNRDPDGLWREGRVAQALNRPNVAKDRYRQVLALQPTNVRALLALAEVETLLAANANPAAPFYEQAERLYDEVIRLSSSQEILQIAETRRRGVRIALGKEQSDDEALNVLQAAETARRSGDDPSGETELNILREGLESTGYEPRIAVMLAERLLAQDRLDEAKDVIRRTADENTGEESSASIDRISAMLDADSVADAYAAIIDAGDSDPGAKGLQKFRIYDRFGMTEQAEAALAAAAAFDSEETNSALVETRFVRALRADQIDEAERLARVAAEKNLDTYGGRTFAARLAAYEGDHAESARLLEEITESGAADAIVYRLLGVELQRLGRAEAALDAFRQAVAIREFDIPSINSYVSQLVRVGETELALAEAERLRAYAYQDQAFRDLYIDLLASAGDDAGLAQAIRLRENRAENFPDDLLNKARLASLYIEDDNWADSRALLDELRAKEDSLGLVRLDARWYADQGRVRIDGEWRDGVSLMRGVYIDYILSREEDDVQADIYLSMAQDMFERGLHDEAFRAIDVAKEKQNQEFMPAQKTEALFRLALNQPERAEAPLKAIIENGADDASGLWRTRLIDVMIRTDRFDEARTLYAGLSDDQKQSLGGRLQLADIERGEGNYQESIQILNEVVRQNPENPQPYIQRARALMAERNRDRDAMDDLDTALRLDGDNVTAWRIKAGLHYRANQRNDAIDALTRVIELNPRQTDVLLSLMIDLIQSGDDGRALDVAMQVIDERSSDISVMIQAAAVFMDRQLWERAAVVLNRAWELTASTEIAVRYIDVLVNQESPDVREADAVVERLRDLGVDPETDSQVLISRALIESARGRENRAQAFMTQSFDETFTGQANTSAVFEEQINWSNNLPRLFGTENEEEIIAYLSDLIAQRDAPAAQDWLRFHRARILLRRDELEPEGVSTMLALAEGDNTNETVRLFAYRTIAGHEYGKSDYERAAELWEAGVARYPNDWEMLNNLAYTYAVHLDRAEEAVPLARRSVDLNTAASEPLDTLAQAQKRVGDYEGALESLNAASFRVVSTRARMNVQLSKAELSLATGDAERAALYYEDVDTTLRTLPSLQSQFVDRMAEIRSRIEEAGVTVGGGDA